MGNGLWSWSHLSALTSIIASWIPLVTDWHASPTDLCRAMHSLDGPRSATLSTSAMLLHFIPARGFPTSWGLLQLFLWLCQQVCGKCLDVLLCQSQIITNLIALSGPLCTQLSAFQFFFSRHTMRGAGYSMTCLSCSLSVKDRSSQPLEHTFTHASTLYQGKGPF